MTDAVKIATIDMTADSIEMPAKDPYACYVVVEQPELLHVWGVVGGAASFQNGVVHVCLTHRALVRTIKALTSSGVE